MNINVPFNALSGLRDGVPELKNIATRYAEKGHDVAGPLQTVCESLQNLSR